MWLTLPACKSVNFWITPNYFADKVDYTFTKVCNEVSGCIIEDILVLLKCELLSSSDSVKQALNSLPNYIHCQIFGTCKSLRQT